MKTKEKLQHFYNLSIESARADAHQLIQNHQNALDKLFSEHKATAKRQAETELKTESDRLKRDFNREISSEQLHIRQRITDVQTELKDRLFEEVKAKLEAFKSAPEYEDLLYQQIKEAISFAAGDELVIHIDPSDEKYLASLTRRLEPDGLIPSLSDESFIGGICAVIRSKNILIDHSFLTAIEDEKEKFSFDGGCCYE